MTYLEQLLEIRGLLEQIDESQLCEKCMEVLAPVLLKSYEIVSVSVNEKAEGYGFSSGYIQDKEDKQ